MKVLVTGGAGFIGSTVTSRLLDSGHDAVIVDNFSTGRREFTSGRPAYDGDFADRELLDTIFEQHPDISAVLHCAALIVVPESVADPVSYYRNNVSKTLELMDYLNARGCHRMVFSGSASIYALTDDFTVDEDCPFDPMSPYARTKAVLEGMMADVAAATDLKIISLRYFNPIGADPQLRTGLQLEKPTHALGKLIEAKETGEPFQITGVDWPTRDGSGIRDYIHVWDLAAAHVAALERFDTIMADGTYLPINLGTGRGTTVRELVAAFDEVTGTPLQTVDAPPRPGDAAGVYTRSTRAKELLGWEAEHSISEGIADTLKWFEVRGSILQGF
ncbi:UDP-glucose 4-epimerase GalE [Corynebacterium sp.]|uniref:UDP-glucose 4-epimerase GalE n=1 Tax=Corynebacterium sp. TaxID=1720 RepID=UPI0026DB9390|nr:UDP-glucose 4-epimerase GalE [Corynebacterium sp.]MDO5076616.1 UDP-glucose 4-epimerase GalE [Corynebacterium sp.]